MNRLTLTTCLATSLLWIVANPVFAIPVGTIEDWWNAPNRTIGLDDKNFVLLAYSDNWNGTEKVNLAYIPEVDAHGLGIDTLESYPRPITLSVSFRIDITPMSPKVFAAVGMDQDIFLPNVKTYKDIYLTEESFNAAGLPGTGTIPLSITNFTPDPFPPVFLPTPWTQKSLWVRDTIVIDGTGSVQSISNTFVQTVPEPSSMVLTAFGIGLAAVLPRRLRRLNKARRGSGLAA